MRANLMSRSHTLNRLRRPAEVGLAISVAALLLLALASCNSSTSRPQTSVGTRSAAGGQPSATSAAPTLTPSPATPPTATLSADVLQVSFSEQYSAAPCGGTSPAGTTCVSTTGSGQDAALGNVSLSRTSVYAPLGTDSCASATTQGTLTVTTTGDTVTFTGTGTFCGASQIADFTYTITGGSGAYQHASGTGSIHVPLPSSSSTGTEAWSGSLLMS